MKEFVCEDCKGKSYSAADLDKQMKEPEYKDMTDIQY